MKKLCLALTMLLAQLAAPAEVPSVTVYKTKTCGCCGKWVEHLKANGFAVNVQEVPSTAEYRQKYGVPVQLQSCHTATMGAYAIEGHVPASDIQRLLKSGAKVKGLAVPRMPAGSPGMESDHREAYAVMQFDANGNMSVFQRYPGD